MENSITPNSFIIQVVKSGKMVALEFSLNAHPKTILKGIQESLNQIDAVINAEKGIKEPTIKLAGIDHLKKIPVDEK